MAQYSQYSSLGTSPLNTFSTFPRQKKPTVSNPSALNMMNTPSPFNATKTTTPSVPTMSNINNATPVNTASMYGKSNYTVSSGDTLSAIAQRSGMSLNDLLDLNPQYRANPNLIRPGEQIKLTGGLRGGTPPAPSVNQTYSPAPNVATNPITPQINPETGGITPAIPQTPQSQDTTLPTPTPEIPTPETPAVVSPYETPEYKKLLEAYTTNLGLSPEEIAAQEELNRLQQSFRTGYQNTEDQAIPMEFITGQQRSLEQRALNLDAPLQDRMALAQARRLANLEGSKFALEQADKRIASQQGQIQEFGGNLVRIRPDGTVDTIAEGPTTSAEGFTLSPGQVRYDAAGNVVANAPKDLNQQLEEKLKQIELQNKINDVNNGILTESEIKNIDSSPQGKKLLLLNDLKQSIEQYKTLVEEYGRGILPGQKSILENAWSDLAIKWKEAAKLGALTGPDIELVEKNIPNAAGFGLLTGKQIVNVLDKSLDNMDVDRKSAYDQLISKNPNYANSQYVQNLYNANEQNNPFIGGGGINDPFDFNKVGSDTNVAAIREAIGKYESGGNYQARGPVVQSGTYAGERALGKYQIMPGNLPSWSKAALGRVVSQQEFLNSPQIQDAIAQYKMNEIFQKYGNAADVASVWFSGRPVARAGNASDVLGTTVPQYVRNILNYLG